ncbi:MAG: ABC transporter permease [Actinomycetota bacterium]
MSATHSTSPETGRHAPTADAAAGAHPARARHGPVRRSLDVVGAPFVAAVVLIALWYLVIAAADIRPFLVPTPHAIVEEFVANIQLLLDNGWVTMLEALGGLGLSIVGGVILAILIAEIPAFSKGMMPWLVMSQAVPKVAVAPLFVIWFGFDLTPKVIVAFFIAFFPIVVSTASGLRSVSPEEIDLFRTMTRRRWPLYRYLKIPRALPQFFDGVKVGTTLALIGAVVGEFVSAQEGLGYMVLIANRNLDTPLMFAVFVALSLIGILLFYGVALIERLLIPWHAAARVGAQTSQEG